MKAICICGKEVLQDWLNPAEKTKYCGQCGSYTHPAHVKEHPDADAIKRL